MSTILNVLAIGFLWLAIVFVALCLWYLVVGERQPDVDDEYLKAVQRKVRDEEMKRK